MALELISFEDLDKLLSLGKADISDYPALEVINDSMVSAFEEYLGRKLESTARTEVIYAYSTSKSIIKLPGIPVASVASVTVTQSGVDESWSENDNFDITGYGIKLLIPIKNSKITIVYTGGLSLVSEEPNLNRAALYQISYEFQNKERIGSSRVSSDGGSVEVPELGLLKETKRLLTSSIHPLYTGSGK